MLEDNYGLWGLIKAHINPNELSEIIHILGRSCIDNNQMLWRELTALREIYTEVHMLNSCSDVFSSIDINNNNNNNNNNSSSSSSSNTSGNNMKNKKVPTLKNPSSSSSSSSINNNKTNNKSNRINNNNNNNNNNNDSERRNPPRSPEQVIQEDFNADDLFQSIKKMLNYTDIDNSHLDYPDSSVKEKILHGLKSENKELEKEIRLIQGNVDDEVEIMSPMNSNRSRSSVDSNDNNGNYINSSGSNNGNYNNGSGSNGSGSWDNVIQKENVTGKCTII